MAEFIERGGKLFPTPFRSEEHGDYRQGWNHCLRAIYQQPAADVQPIVRGKWLPGSGEKSRTCSVCHITQSVNIYQGRVMFEYCPYCGAKMKETNNDKK